MNREFSAGVVVYYKRAKKIEYLLLHYESGHWDFPKGHIEKKETKQETALRELKEETGLVVKLEPDFETAIVYFFAAQKTKALVYKKVYFFVGKAKKKKVTLSYEHIGFAWLPYKAALEQITYDNAKKLLKNVHAYISKK